MGAQLADARFVFALLFAGELALLDLLRQFVEVGDVELGGGEHDQLDSGFAGHIQEHLVVGVSFHVPQTSGRPSRPPGPLWNTAKSDAVQVCQDFAFQRFEIQIHG